MELVHEMANQRLTYILWFFFGWTGLHHVYLGRLNQAFIWFATLGGGCGVGWVRDYWRIPDYLGWCNDKRSARMRYLNRTSQGIVRECSIFRVLGMAIMGRVVSVALGALVPDFTEMSYGSLTYYSCKCAYLALLILGNAIGIYAVSNIGEFRCRMYPIFLTSFIITSCVLGSINLMYISCFLTAFVTWFVHLHWRPVISLSAEPPHWKKILCYNMSLYLLGCFIWLFLLVAGVYVNASVTVQDGQQIPVREAVNNFFQSEAWKRMKDFLYHFISVCWQAGPRQAWNDVGHLMDLKGEIGAYTVLGLAQNASQDEITKSCRKLSAKNHPDHFKTETEKDAAQERFFEIQRACEALSLSLARRSRNMKAPVD